MVELFFICSLNRFFFCFYLLLVEKQNNSPMARLELPSDVLEQIVQKLDIADRPAVLIYHRASPAWSVVKVKVGCISETEIKWLDITDKDEGWWTERYHHCGNSHHHVTELVHRAMAIGFKFPNEEARSRAASMDDFEMEKAI
jgi:hypothetical protein